MYTFHTATDTSYPSLEMRDLPEHRPLGGEGLPSWGSHRNRLPFGFKGSKVGTTGQGRKAGSRGTPHAVDLIPKGFPGT